MPQAETLASDLTSRCVCFLLCKMGPLYLPHRVVSKPCLDGCPVRGEAPARAGSVPSPDRVIPAAHRVAGQLQSLKAAAHVLVSVLPTARPGRPPASGSQGKLCLPLFCRCADKLASRPPSQPLSPRARATRVARAVVPTEPQHYGRHPHRGGHTCAVHLAVTPRFLGTETVSR